MRKFGKESAAPADSGADRESGNGWFSGHRCALILGVIVIVAFLLRFVFAYGVSADGNFALSGGSSAQYHLHVIESILNGSWAMTDAAVNYPIGGSLYIPPLMDFLAAGVASIFGGSMGTTEAASMALAVLNPIFGALLCIPVYLIGKEMFDKTIGVVAALIIAFMALPISTSVFSSGNEYALAAFLIAFMAYFAVKMVKALDAEEPSRKTVLINGAVAGIFMMLAALTWNGFRIAVVLVAVAMVLQAVASRVRGKDFTDATLGFAVMILIGTLVPAAYYVPAGLMDAVYSGPVLIAIVSVVFTFVFMALREKPWVVTIPALVVVFLVFCAVLAVAAPGMYNDFIFGNSVYTSSIMEQLASSHVSMSNVAAYYGWLTMWLPICLAIYETYVYLRRDRSATQLFMVVWLFVMFFATWTSYATAAVVGSVFAVGSAAVIVGMFREAKVRDWASDVKAAGMPGCFRKMVKPFPLVSVLVVALLVIVPNFSFAVDAGQPSNTEGDAFYAGNTTFTIKTGDSYPMGKVWDNYRDTDKNGALVSWIDYSYDAVTQGKFDSVTDTIGGGSTAAAQMYLANGSGATVAAMMLRIMLANPDTNFATCFSSSSVYDEVRAFIQNPSSAVEEVRSNPDTYGKVNSDISEENAVYLASINAMTEGMNQKQIMDAYDKVCDLTGSKIGYMVFDGSMLPLQYSDGDSFSTIAYFADYQLDKYGAATQFYSYNTYYGTTNYTSAIYDTTLWRAMIGPTATEAGYSSSYSYLVALSLSDGKEGSAKAVPGYGLAGFTVGQWLVMYNADNDATVSSDGWKYMDAYEAMEKQKTDGGMINYLYSIVMLEYTGVEGATTYDGAVYSGGSAVSGATVDVYYYSETYGKEIIYSSTTTGSDGKYTALVPPTSYRIDVKIGDLSLVSFDSSNPESSVIVEQATVTGAVKVDDEVYSAEKMMLKLKGDAQSKDVEITDGTISISGILPGTYTYTLYGETGTSLGTGSLTIYPGESVGLVITPTTKTITATVNDIYGKTVDGTSYESNPIVIATNTSTGAQFTQEIGDDGKAVITVVPGTYTVSLGNGLVSMNSNTQNASSSNRSVTMTAYESKTVTLSGAPASVPITVYGGSYSGLAYTDGGVYKFDVPVGLATDAMSYSVYAVSGDSVYYGVYTGGDSLSLTSETASKASGTVKNGDSGMKSTVIFTMNSTGFQLTATTDSDGKYTVLLPQGSYSVYANNGSDKVVLGTMAVAGKEVSKDFSAVDGRKVTAYYKYDPATSESNKALPFALALIKFTYEETEYVMSTMTNTSGSAVFYIPDSIEATTYLNGTDGVLNNDVFDCTDTSRSVSKTTSSTSTTLTIQYVGYEESQKNTVKQVSYTAEYKMKLTFYKDLKTGDKEFTMEAGETRMLTPGQYEVVIDGSTGGYFKGTAYIYPGQDAFSTMEVEEVEAVSITKNDSDAVTITTEDGSYHAFTGGYYFEKGYKYYLKSVGKDSDGNETLKYGLLDLTESATAPSSIDMKATALKISVTGYVGISASGDLTVTADGFEREFTITNGAYTMELPADVGTITATAQVTATVDSEEYKFAATAEFSGMKDGSIRNVAVVNSDFDDDDDDEDDEPEFEVTVDDANFANGTAKVEFTIKNLTSSTMTYQISTGSAWSLYRVTQVTVPVNASATVTVTGTYDDSRVAPGLDGVTLVVKDINGSSTVTKKITENSAAQTGTLGMDVLKAGDSDVAANDKVSPSQYMYALTFVNKDVYAKDVSLSDLNVPSGWTARIMDADGTIVADVADGFTIYGLQTVTYYVSFMKTASESGDSEKAPSLSVTVKYGNESKIVSSSPVEISVDTEDSSASGGDAVNKRSGVPSGIWFLVAVIILMLIAVFWLASKRGVFARK